MATPTSTLLKDRVLLSNGITLVEPDSPILNQAIKSNLLQCIRVTAIDEQVKKFNRISTEPIKALTAGDLTDNLPSKFNIPEKFLSIDLEEFLLKRLFTKYRKYSIDDIETIVDRMYDELQWFTQRGKQDILRLMIYIVHTLQTNNVPWGVGRGSSVNSLLLFLIGVHDIDPIEYDLDWREFMRD